MTVYTSGIVCARCGTLYELRSDEPTPLLRIDPAGLAFHCPTCGVLYPVLVTDDRRPDPEDERRGGQS